MCPPATLVSMEMECWPAEDAGVVVGRKKAAMALSIDGGETTERRVRRLISENPVVIFSRTSCCMCHVVKRLLATIGVHPAVIELDDAEIESARAALGGLEPDGGVPVVFIGGASVGGLEALMGLHLSGRLLPKLQEVGALWS